VNIQTTVREQEQNSLRLNRSVDWLFIQTYQVLLVALLISCFNAGQCLRYPKYPGTEKKNTGRSRELT